MNPSDLFRFATDSLRRRIGRTILTVIGVVVGVCAIVVMVSLGIAVNQATEAMLQSWGDLTKIQVFSFGAQRGTPDLDDKMVARFKSMPNVVAATPMKNSNVLQGNISEGTNGRYQIPWANFVGMDPEAVEPMGYELLTGTYFEGRNYPKDTIPVLVDAQTVFSVADTRKSERNPDRMKYPEVDYNDPNWYVAEPANMPKYSPDGELLNPEDSFFDFMKADLTYNMQVGVDENTQEPIYKQYKLLVVGMIKSKSSQWEVQGRIILPLDTMKKLENDYYKASGTRPSASGGGGGIMSYGPVMSGGEGTTQVGGYDTVYLKADNVDNMPDLEKSLKEIGYQISSMSEMRAQLQGQVAQTQMMLGGLAAVSLFVAALNIMNTMTMAIYERTREIGVMKVLGCRLSNIRAMFLIESGTIGLLGGVIGVVVSFILSLLLNYLPIILAWLGVQGTIDIAAMFGLGGLTAGGATKLSVIPMWLVLLALAFATGVGVLSGIAPANKAVKISSLEAIRHE